MSNRSVTTLAALAAVALAATARAAPGVRRADAGSPSSARQSRALQLFTDANEPKVRLPV